VTPAGLHVLEVWVDQRTHYVSRFVFAEGQMRTELSAYRQVGPVWVPFVTEENGVTSRVISVELDPPGADAVAFSAPERL
jgi:hypothetical protein